MLRQGRKTRENERVREKERHSERARPLDYGLTVETTTGYRSCVLPLPLTTQDLRKQAYLHRDGKKREYRYLILKAYTPNLEDIQLLSLFVDIM